MSKTFGVASSPVGFFEAALRAHWSEVVCSACVSFAKSATGGMVNIDACPSRPSMAYLPVAFDGGASMMMAAPCA